ncbi:hypothetical protein CPB86DRAFT_195189 [Serendipita vermifera]|nr:hypothetical protein CPB86DRAFT_195189 [Serendipita vermifera]
MGNKKQFKGLGLGSLNLFKKKETAKEDIRINMRVIQGSDFVLDLTSYAMATSRAASTTCVETFEPIESETDQLTLDAANTAPHPVPIVKSRDSRDDIQRSYYELSRADMGQASSDLVHPLNRIDTPTIPSDIPRYGQNTIAIDRHSWIPPLNSWVFSTAGLDYSPDEPLVREIEIVAVSRLPGKAAIVTEKRNVSVVENGLPFLSHCIEMDSDDEEENEAIENLILQHEKLAAFVSLMPVHHATSGDLDEIVAPALETADASGTDRCTSLGSSLVRPSTVHVSRDSNCIVTEDCEEIISSPNLSALAWGTEDNESLLGIRTPLGLASVESLLAVMEDPLVGDHTDILRMLATAGSQPQLLTVEDSFALMQQEAHDGLDELWSEEDQQLDLSDNEVFRPQQPEAIAVPVNIVAPGDDPSGLQEGDADLSFTAPRSDDKMASVNLDKEDGLYDWDEDPFTYRPEPVDVLNKDQGDRSESITNHYIGNTVNTFKCPIPNHRSVAPRKSALRGTATTFSFVEAVTKNSERGARILRARRRKAAKKDLFLA